MSELLITRKTDPNPQEYTEPPQNKPITVNQTNFTDFLTPLKTMVMDSKFPQYMNHPYDKNNWWVVMDHCYSRPWNWRPESAFLRPTKTLFIPKPMKRKSINPLAPIQDSNDEDVIDVEATPNEPAVIYDKKKAKVLMEECEKHAILARGEEGDGDWEEKVSKVNWSPIQNRLFNGIVNILNSHHLGQLAYVDSHNEAICRRTIIDKSVERVRKLFATISWDFKIAQWLHQLLIDNLSTSYLTAYLDILQTLKSKLPTFVDKFTANTNSNKLSILNYESLFPLLKRAWDPVAQSLMQDKPKKLPGNPIILIVPSSQPINSKRLLKWINLLSNLGTVISVPLNYGSATNSNSKMTMTTFVDQMFVTTRGKIQDIRVDYPGRNIVLVGFNSGATLAMQIAQIEQVLCCICLGFSLYTAEGKRGEPDDNLLELQCPVLFIVGQCSNTLQEDMEDLRERMRVETGLIVVGSADDYLRVNKKKKRAEGITQSVVDRCIADEIGEFISGVIMSPYPPQIRQSPTNLTNDGIMSKKMKTERKRYNSNTSSLDSEPPSPTPRITRPGQNNSSNNLGRPPGSKTKNKWTNQGIPPLLSPSPSPPPPYSLNTDTSSNDSFLNDNTKSDMPPLKKLKTLKPVQTNNTPNTSPNKNHVPVKLQGLTAQGRNLSALLQNEIQSCTTQKFPTSSAIKVLENVKINPGTAQKVFSNNGKTISVLNTTKNLASSLVLLPDGKIKSISPGSRYITSKRQLIGNKPPKPMKKLSYLQTVPPTSNLPPPTNLSTQDIMDLPIIFADDQMIDNQVQNPDLNKHISQPSTSKIISTTTGNKFVLINKQNNSNFIITNKNQKLPTPKYAKVVVSSKRNPNVQLKTTPENLPTELKKVDKPIEVLDLENEIVASTVFKHVGENSKEEGETPTKIPKLENSVSEL